MSEQSDERNDGWIDTQIEKYTERIREETDG